VPWLRRLVAGLSRRRPVSVHVGFVVGTVALGQVFLRVLRFSLINISLQRCCPYYSSCGGLNNGPWWPPFRDIPIDMNNTNNALVFYSANTRFEAIGVRSPAGAKDFSSNLCFQTSSEAHPASYPMGTGVLSPGQSAAGA
jgi:hypothetical protein